MGQIIIYCYSSHWNQQFVEIWSRWP